MTRTFPSYPPVIVVSPRRYESRTHTRLRTSTPPRLRAGSVPVSIYNLVYVHIHLCDEGNSSSGLTLNNRWCTSTRTTYTFIFKNQESAILWTWCVQFYEGDLTYPVICCSMKIYLNLNWGPSTSRDTKCLSVNKHTDQSIPFSLKTRLWILLFLPTWWCP
jgi:hypothetical protein